MAKKKLTTTRNTEFNSYIDSSKYINSASDITSTKENSNIRLLDYDSFIYKKGFEIIKDASKNHAIEDLTKRDIKIDTKLINSQDCYIFGAPHKIVFDNRQQYNNCGIESVLNILAMAGKIKITNQNKTESDFTKKFWALGMADDGGQMGFFDHADGGTKPAIYKEIFDYYGIKTEEHFGKGDNPTTDVLTLAKYIKSGGSAIVGVSADLLWYGSEAKVDDIALDHAVAVVGVVYNVSNPDDTTKPLGFFIHDTGGWMSRYIDYDEFLTIVLNNKLEVDGVKKDGFFATIITEPIKQGTDNINATGTNQVNIIYGNSSDNIIKGLGGDDILAGSGGNDRIYGGSGNDIIWANGVVKKEEYISLIKDENIKSVINSTDFVKDETSDSLFVGRNFVYGGSGNDYLFGGEYNDTLEGGNGIDYLFGRAGIDVIKGGSGDDCIYGGDGNDRLYGNSGKDYIEGNDGDDTIIAGSGNDIIIGGKGEDVIECGSGKDRVIFEKGCETDLVKSSGGSVVLEFIGDDENKTNVLNLDISLTEQSSSKKYLSAFFDGKQDGVNLSDFYNIKTNKTKKVYIKDDIHSDNYRISVTKSKGNISVAEKNGNNYLISTSVKNNVVKTGSKNDIVFLANGNNKITYTSGEDYYYLNEGNDTYNISKFDKESFLSINDCTDISDKGLSPSTGDILNFQNNLSSDLALFFDVSKTGIINNKDLFIINKSDVTVNSDYLLGVLSNKETGVVEISEYFSKKNPQTQNYVGFGCIENIKAKGENLDIDTAIKTIAHDVAGWLSDKEYISVSDAIEKGAENISELIGIFTDSAINHI